MHRILRLALLAATAALLAATARAQLRVHGRYSVTQAEVERAIAKAFLADGVPVEMPRVTLLTDVGATEVSPLLDVTSITALPEISSSHIGEMRIAVRLACHVVGACMPFYAVVAASPVDFATHLAAANLAHLDRQRPPVVLHAGSQATLVLRDGRASLAIPVVSLENATIGQSIRVRSEDRKHIYTAHALSANLLEGSF